MVLADVAVGALAPGVNGATLLVFNGAALGAGLALAALLATPAGRHPAVWPHVAAALAVAAVLVGAVNCLVAQSGGTVAAADQRRALGLDDADKKES